MSDLGRNWRISKHLTKEDKESPENKTHPYTLALLNLPKGSSQYNTQECLRRKKEIWSHRWVEIDKWITGINKKNRINKENKTSQMNSDFQFSSYWESTGAEEREVYSHTSVNTVHWGFDLFVTMSAPFLEEERWESENTVFIQISKSELRKLLNRSSASFLWLN